jgi:hypothetical protein
VVLALVSLAGCSGTTAQPPGTVGTVPVVAEPATLLPVVADTLPSDNTVGIAPGTLFGGERCSALVTGDFDGVAIGGSATTFVAASVLAEDACGYELKVAGKDVTVFVQAESADAFDHPVTTAQAIDRFDGLGEEAIGVNRGDTAYEVIVRVSNGYFSVTAPDKGSARALAGAAAKRALRP